MKIRGGAHIDTTGLIFHVDAGSPISNPLHATKWYDLSGNNYDLTYTNGTGYIVQDNENGIKSFYRTVVNTTTENYKGSDNINLQNDCTFIVWAKIIDCPGASANGVLTNHRYSTNSGLGITVKEISTSDFRICCNTGTGSSRTYNTYGGTSNIKDKWSFLLLRFIKSTNNLTLWVNAEKEVDITYAQVNTSLPIELFQWSTFHENVAYKPEQKIAIASIYDIGLTDAQIDKYFQATRKRFNV